MQYTGLSPQEVVIPQQILEMSFQVYNSDHLLGREPHRYHLLMYLESNNIKIEEVMSELEKRKNELR